MIHTRGLIILLAVSYLFHAMLLVNTAENEARRTQTSVGRLLAGQMAINAAPLMVNRDSVGLGLMTDRFSRSGDVLGVRILTPGNVTLAGSGPAQTQTGILYTAPIIMDKQPLGMAEVVLAAPARGELVRNSSPGLLLSLLLHALIGVWLRWPTLISRFHVPILQPLPALRRHSTQNAPTPEPPVPVKPASSMLMQIVLDDAKGLMQRVNASTTDQLLLIMEKLLHRAVKLYQGKIIHPFGPEGALVRFDGDTDADTADRALACSRLYLALADAAYQQRRSAKLFSLPVKLAVRHMDEREEGIIFDEVMQLARRGEREALLIDASPEIINDLQARHELESLAQAASDLAAPSLVSTIDSATGTDNAAPEATVTSTEMVVNGEASAESESPAVVTEASISATEMLVKPDEVMKKGPWRVKALAAGDEARIEEQRKSILERKKAQTPAETV